MRHEFSAATKDLLARRVSYKCSNPGCRQPTSGPQANPAGAINLGVAAHITAASPDGPRYDATLTPEERSSTANGIWLCQTDAKLVDNDAIRYPVDCLKDWKARAEASAARELEQRLRRDPDSAAVFERMERLMPALLAEMRQDLTAYPLRREFVVMERGLLYWAKGNELVYYYNDHPDLDDKLRILETGGLVQNITYNNATRFVLTERLAEYLGAP